MSLLRTLFNRKISMIRTTFLSFKMILSLCSFANVNLNSFKSFSSRIPVLLLLLFFSAASNASSMKHNPSVLPVLPSPEWEALRQRLIGRSIPEEEACPIRNENAVREAGMVCVRKCQADEDCTNDRKLCLCDSLCGLSCIRPEKECPELPDPDHGQVTLQGRHFKDLATYSCDSGFQIVGVGRRSCQASGRWSGRTPSCRKSSGGAKSPFYCSAPPIIEHASHNASREQQFFDMDTAVSYRCFPGYTRTSTGFSHSKCFFLNETATWFGPDLTCAPVECGPPEELLHGRAIPDCTTFRCQVTYSCSPGFMINGHGTRICGADGVWTSGELPTCVPVQCDIPDNPINGKALYTATAYKSVVSYECKYGYMIIGEDTRTCGEDRQWTGKAPECREINCGPPGGGHLPNGWLEGSQSTLHKVITFRCEEGMKFEGDSHRTTCQADGKWSHPLPKCLAPCIIPEIEFGEVANLTVGKKLPHGTEITVNCRENYEVTGGSGAPLVCNNGTWSQVARCVPARCKSMPDPPGNGMIVVPKTGHGERGLYQCKDGYVLKGSNTTTCLYGVWEGLTPTCAEVYCPWPGYLEGGKVLLVGNMGLYDYRPYVKRIKNDRQIIFVCDKGFKLALGSVKGATCIDGQWSPANIPTCVPENHPAIKWLEKRSIDEEDLRNAFPNITLKDLTRRKRSVQQEHCPDLNLEVMTAKIMKRRGGGGGYYNADGVTLKVSCSSGFSLNLPKAKVRCRRGEWKPKAPECRPSPCKVPGGNQPLPGGGPGGPLARGVQGEVPSGQYLSLSCRAGYSMKGSAYLTCQYGAWTGPLPKCKPNPCILPELPGGEYSGMSRGGARVEHNSLIEFHCQIGVAPVHPVQCKAGRLVPKQPACVVNHQTTSTGQFQNEEEYFNREAQLPMSPDLT